MTGIFAVFMGLAMLAVLASLGLGLFTMARGGEYAKKYGNKMMRLRVITQAAAIGFFLLAILVHEK
jgi:Hypoxia induced protein conserved region